MNEHDPNTVAVVAAILRLAEEVRMQGNYIRMAIEETSWDVTDMSTQECITEANRILDLATRPRTEEKANG